MIKKRLIIAIILTIGALIATNGFWLTFKPFTFKMFVGSEAKNEVTIKTELNRKNDDSFKRAYSEQRTINLDEPKYYEVIFNRKTPPKKLRLIFSNLIPNTKYEISNLTFKNERIHINNLSAFKSEKAKLKVENNKLVFIPSEKNVALNYGGGGEKLSVRPSIRFDFSIFLIIGICLFLLFYKLTNYLADFKINKNASRLDIIFLAVCAILMFIPISHINQDRISTKENRKLTVFKPLFNEDKTINFNFGKDFDAWISDRFNCRAALVNAYNNLAYKIAGNYHITQKAYLDKKTNWMFGFPIVLEKLSSSKIEESIKGLNGFDKFCKENNIKLYLLIVPDKNDIYIQQTIAQKKYQDSYTDSINVLKSKTHVPIIYPYNELLNASKKDYVFFKTDHHWTDWGTYIGYKELIKEIKKDYPYIKEVQKNDFNIAKSNYVRADWERDYSAGHTYNLINLNSKFANKILNTEYNYYNHKNEKLLKTSNISIKKLREKNFRYPHGANLKALMIGTSMNENLTGFLPYAFKNTKYIRLNNVQGVPEDEIYKIFKQYKKKILEYKPNIIVLCITAQNLGNLGDLTKED